VNAEANRLANALRALGIGPGDVVGFHMPNIPQYYFGLIAVSKLGAVGSGVSPLLAPPELAHQISDAKIKVLMSFEALGPAVAAMSAPDCLDVVMICGARDMLDAPEVTLPDLGALKTTTYAAAVEGADSNFDTISVDAGDTFMIQYTGGTTGKPKGAMLSHRTLLHNPLQVLALAPEVQIGEEVYVSAFPLFHIAGLCFCLMSFVTGGSYELLPDPRDTDRFCDMSDIFGMTETGPCHTSNPVSAPKAGSVGLPCAGAKIRIRDVETGEKDMPLGEIGEICSAGPQLMKGYLGLPEESARARSKISLRACLWSLDLPSSARLIRDASGMMSSIFMWRFRRIIAARMRTR